MAAGSAAAIILARDARAAQAPPRALADGRLAGTRPLDLPAAARVPLERLLDTGLDARLFTDLSQLTADTLVTPNESFFVRTASPRQLPPADSWSISLSGLVGTPGRIAVTSLASDVRPFGVHLAECSGNTPPTFGLISAAAWDGVPLAAVLDRARRRPEATHVLVSGVDDQSAPLRTSVPGASWVFALTDRSEEHTS